MKNEQSTVALSDEQREKLINLVDRLIRNPSAVTAKDCIIDGDTRSLQWIADHTRALLTSPRSDGGASNLAEHAAKALEKRRRQAQFEWTDDQFEIWWNKDDRCNRAELIEDVRFILGFAERAAVSPATPMLNACDANALRTAIDAAEIAKFIDAERAVELRDIVMRSAVPPATADEQRAAFEAEVSEKSGLSCACDVRGRYIDPTVRGMWEARQADRASQVAAPFEIEPPEAGGYKGKLPALARTLQGQRIYSLGYSRGRKKGLEDASQAAAPADARHYSAKDAGSGCANCGRALIDHSGGRNCPTLAEAREPVGIVRRPAFNGQDFSVEWLRPPAAGAIYDSLVGAHADAGKAGSEDALLTAARRAIPALAHAAERNPAYQRDYEELSKAIEDAAHNGEKS
ncbi:hypothetical protein [Burkholderia pseudomallei]|uniref:hypothetical protein n=1 Tax=Burkholderia pseudomallei TaxID=28450 RepID=UPI0012F4EDBC|nr:hypothetical protein [Burkholderia pseudomallei]